VCADGRLLAGPSAPPPGAVPVADGADLPALTQSSPAGSTFWIAPGVHTLGGGEFDQVIPKSDDHFIGAPGAVIDGQHLNKYAFTGMARGVIVEHLTIRNFGRPGDNNNEGVVNHDAGASWTLRYNTVTANAGAGVFVGRANTLSWNCLARNGQYGFSAYRPDGVTNVVVDHNEIAGNNTDNWEKRQPGCGCTGGGKFWATNGAKVTDNYVHDNRGAGLWADTNNVGFLFSGNYIASNDSEGLFYEISYNARIVDNTFVRNGIVAGPANPGFPTGAIYLSESGSDSRVPGPYGAELLISANTFTDNWDGVVLWENADRYCNSPANTSGGVCTLVDPSGQLAAGCTAAHIKQQPYYSDCRWKTQNVRVSGNAFTFDPQRVGHGCAKATSCGQNGIFSNFGTFPTWSPYKGVVVENAILRAQHNVFAANRYQGPWTFVAGNTGKVLSLANWQAQPIRQDTGSRG
jgi:hypothetical protein